MRMSMEQLQGKVQRWMRIAPEELKKMLLKGAKLVTKEAQLKHLSGPIMPYKVGHPTRATLGSGKGRKRPFRLRKSITEKVTVSKDKVTAQVGTNVTNKGFSYPRLHEEGGRYHPERPFLRPSLEEKKPRIMELILDGFMGAYEKSG